MEVLLMYQWLINLYVSAQAVCVCVCVCVHSVVFSSL